MCSMTGRVVSVLAKLLWHETKWKRRQDELLCIIRIIFAQPKASQAKYVLLTTETPSPSIAHPSALSSLNDAYLVYGE